jgi:hypothetical protein
MKTTILEQEKQLAKFIATLPSDYLEHLARIDTDAKRSFYEHRSRANLISKCWLSRMTGADNPIQEAYMQGKIPEATHRQIWSQVRFLQNLWSIIQLGEPHIRNAIKNEGIKYPFSCSADLFAAIVRGWFDSGYAVLLEDYSSEVSKMKELALVGKAYIENNFECSDKRINRSDQLRSLTAPYEHIQEKMNYWFVFSIQVCFEAAMRDTALRDEMYGFHQGVDSDFNFFQEWVSRKRGSKNYPKLQTTRYIDQQKYTGRS